MQKLLSILFFFIFSHQLFAIENSDSLHLTTEEKSYIQLNNVIKMCNNQNWEPIEFAANDDQSQMSGIAIDVLKLLEKKLDVTFVNVPTKDWVESQKFLKEKKCDILPAAGKTLQRLEYANFTKPYLDYKIAIITQSNSQIFNDVTEMNGKIMTRKKGSSLVDKMRKLNPEVKIIETNNYLESLTLVQSGDADFTIAPVPEAAYYMSKFGLFDLHIAGYLDDNMKLSIAVEKDNKLLLSILDKSLSSIKPSQMKQIYDDWTNIHFQEKLIDNTLFRVVLFTIFFVSLFFIYKNYLTAKTNRELKKAVHDKTLELEKLNQELRQNSDKLKDLNDNLEQRIIIEIDKVKKIEAQLFQSEKMAAMGEMIGNIAHQWRQPLSLISTSATGVLAQHEFMILEDKYLVDRMNDINNAAQFLSRTIDDFRDLIKGEMIQERFNLEENINKCLAISEPILRNFDIKLIKEIDSSIEIISYQNLLIQSLLNIINNAKDVLIDKNFDKKYIFLTTKIDQERVTLTIKDNGGGINESIKEHIFEPYFTTKHKTQGTGLGLHMTYSMITNELQGSIIVKNRTYEYEDAIYNGAEFIIQLPLRLENN